MKQIKQILFFLLAIMGVATLGGCQQQAQTCHIYGVMGSDQYEGKRIFLVPLTGPATAETVDSIEIKDRRFEFTTDTMQMYKVLMDYHYRMGLQPLIVVGEPGTVKVVIDSVSHATGTPQNDSLEQWKVRTEMHNHRMALMNRSIAELRSLGNIQEADFLKQRKDSFHLVYKNYTRGMAKNMEGTVLGDFLKDLYHLTYKKALPDGTTITIDADTNEEIH